MNLKEKRVLLKELIQKEKLLFFVGPSFSVKLGLPHPREMMETILDTSFSNLQGYNTLINIFKKRLQPEVFYESFLYVNKKYKYLNLLKLYNHYFLAKHNINVYPLAIHKCLVEYSLHSGLPLFTTNTDTVLELTCILKGCSYEVILFSDDSIIDLQKQKNEGEEKVYIIKLNGSSDETLDNIYWTMHQLCRTNIAALDYINSIEKTLGVAIVGYERDDIDYFPQMQEVVKIIRSNSKVPNYFFWITPNIQQEFPQRQNYQDKATQSVQNMLIRSLTKYPAPLISLFDRKTKSLAHKASSATKTNIHILRKTLINQYLADFYFRKSQLVLLLIILCQRSSEYKEGYRIGEESLSLFINAPTIDKVLYNYVMAIFYHHRGKFLSYRKAIKEVKALSKNKKSLIPFIIQTQTSLTEVDRMLIPTIRIDSNKFRAYSSLFLTALVSSVVYLRFMWVERRLQNPKELLKKQRYLPVAEIYALNAIIEHSIRKVSLKQKFALMNIPTFFKPSKNKINEKWEHIIEESQKVGYIGGIGNAYKYLLELDPNNKLKNKLHGINLFNFMSDQIGQELISMNDTLQIEKKGKYEQAKKNYILIYNNALYSDNYLNVIKALTGIIRCNQGLKINPLLTRKQLKNLIEFSNEIEGKWWQITLQGVINIVQSSRK